MRPLLSEFSFGYALTEELASGALGQLIGAPIFPSLIQEGQPGGGYDLQLPLVGAPLFLQFKLSDCMVYRSANEWEIFQRSYYRMHLRPARHSDQHALLRTLEASGEEVYYVAPYFHTTEELNTHYVRKKQLDKQFFTHIADELLHMSADSKEAAPKLLTERFSNNRCRTRKQEAQFAAFLSRSLLNAELIILADINEANEA